MIEDINFDKMRIRLEFSFRLLLQTTRRLDHGNGEPGFPEFSDLQIMHVLSVMVTQAGAIIFERRCDHTWQVSESERANMRSVALVIVEAFNTLFLKLQKETIGYPITLVYAMEEGIIQEGINDILNTLKMILDPAHNQN